MGLKRKYCALFLYGLVLVCVCVFVYAECVLSEYVSMCGGYREEAVFGPRLKCRTRVPLQERRPAERTQRDFSPIRETRNTN